MGIPSVTPYEAQLGQKRGAAVLIAQLLTSPDAIVRCQSVSQACNFKQTSKPVS